LRRADAEFVLQQRSGDGEIAAVDVIDEDRDSKKDEKAHERTSKRMALQHVLGWHECQGIVREAAGYCKPYAYIDSAGQRRKSWRPAECDKNEAHAALRLAQKKGELGAPDTRLKVYW